MQIKVLCIGLSGKSAWADVQVHGAKNHVLSKVGRAKLVSDGLKVVVPSELLPLVPGGIDTLQTAWRRFFKEQAIRLLND